MNDPVLATLGLALRGGNLAVGETPVAEVCRARRGALPLVARDAAENTARRVERAAGRPPMVLPYTKTEVGAALGRGTCAALCVTDPGLAALLQKKLAAREDETKMKE